MRPPPPWRLADAEERGGHPGRRLPETAGDLLDLQELLVAEGHERAGGLLQAPEAALQAAQHVLVGLRLAPLERLAEQPDLEVLLVVVLVLTVAGGALELGEDHEAADRAEPDAEILVGLEVAELLEGADEGLLDDLVDEGGVGHAERGVSEEHVLVAGDDLGIGVAVAGQDSPQGIAQICHATPISPRFPGHYMQIRRPCAYIVYRRMAKRRGCA
jgi:hypothetical protein